jgi:cell division protein FtsA
MAKPEPYFVGIDIGSSKVGVLIGQRDDKGGIEVVGKGLAPNRGTRRGNIVNVEATVEALKAASEEAEVMAGVEISRAYVGIAGADIRSVNSRGMVSVSRKDREVTRQDIQRVLEAAQSAALPSDREILHAIPQEFIVDEQGGIDDPLGMLGTRLEVMVHLVTGNITRSRTLLTCVNRAGIEVGDLVLEQLAASEAVLSADERELGVALIDVGGGTTDLAIFERGSIWHTAVLPVGGDHFTNDLAVGLRTPIPDAERIKKKYGCALGSLVDDDEAIEVPTVGGRKPRLLSRQVMAEILQPRAEELFTLVHEEVVRAGFEKLLNAGVVLTGGGSLLNGTVEICEQVFGLPVRRGQAQSVGGLMEPGSGPGNATAVGLALYAARNRQRDRRRKAAVPVGAGFFGRVQGRVRALFSEMF